MSSLFWGDGDGHWSREYARNLSRSEIAEPTRCFLRPFRVSFRDVSVGSLTRRQRATRTTPRRIESSLLARSPLRIVGFAISPPFEIQMPSMSVGARAKAAAENKCTIIDKHYDMEAFLNSLDKTSDELKNAMRATGSAMAGECQCGNTHPRKFYIGCPEHPQCEECFADTSTSRGGGGVCKVRGCNVHLILPKVSLGCMNKQQQKTEEALKELKHALEFENSKAPEEGILRRAAAVETVHKKRKAEMTDEEWQEEKERRAASRAAGAEKKRKLAEFPQLEKEVEELRSMTANMIRYMQLRGIEKQDFVAYLDSEQTTRG